MDFLMYSRFETWPRETYSSSKSSHIMQQERIPKQASQHEQLNEPQVDDANLREDEPRRPLEENPLNEENIAEEVVEEPTVDKEK